MATAALNALRRGFAQAHITWAVGGWAKHAIENHDKLDAILDTGSSYNPAKTDLMRFVRQLQSGDFDLAISLVRSPWMSIALLLSGIPNRVGIDSAGRGFGYTIRLPVHPLETHHEAQIYLNVVAMLGISTEKIYASVPVSEVDRKNVQQCLSERGIDGPYAVINPAGGSNAGMRLHAKRWPPANFGKLANALTTQLGLKIVLVAGPDDTPIINTVMQHLNTPALTLVGELSFGEIAALAYDAQIYIGNDTGLTHIAAAAGARTAAIFGPSDPARYAPFAPGVLVLCKPIALKMGGVVTASDANWDWQRDGIGVEPVIEKVIAYLNEGDIAHSP